MSPLPSSSSSKSLRNPSRRTRAPLQEMPLEQFLLPPSSSKLGISTKRPVSPGTTVLYSPAKRRILNEEGLSTAKAPPSAKSSTAPATSSQNKQPAKPSQHHYQQQQQSVARFTDALVGPDSPVRKLDFGTPKNVVGSKTPLRQPAEEMLRTLPGAKVGTQSCLRNHEAVEDCFSISSQSQNQTPQPQMQPQSLTSYSSYSSSSPSQPPRHLDFLSAPRDVPPPVDPQSEHYPGFAVYQDPYILIPTLRLTSPALSSASSTTLAPLDDNLDDDSDAESIDSRELKKENLPPRKRAHKVSMAPMPEKSQLFSPLSTKSSSVPATPLREHSLREEILTPRSLAIFGAGVGSGLRKAQHTPSKEDQYSMRRILEEEVDGEQSDD